MSGREYARNVVERVAAQCRSLGQGRSARLNAVDDTRGPFIEQLLRYVDSRRCTRAQATAEGPSIDIDARPGRVVFECNADGLLERDILPLCGTGGIGLDAAFRGAWRVCLQSGDFSFYFGQPTADVFVPIWDQPSDRPPDNKTRITLHLHRGGAASPAREAWIDLMKQVQELQPNHLLFLQQLRQMKITVRNEDDGTVVANNFQLCRRADNVAAVSGSFGSADETPTRECRYFLTRTPIQDALGDPNEDHPCSGNIKDGSPEVVLAFPVDADSVPVIEPQELYSFMPLGEFGFKVRCSIHDKGFR